VSFNALRSLPQGSLRRLRASWVNQKINEESAEKSLSGILFKAENIDRFGGGNHFI